MQLVLSLFPGIGLLDRAFEEEGFCIVRGPDLLWGGDVKRFHPPSSRFEGVIGGPPCQAFSRLRFIVEANGYQVAPNLIPEFERIVFEAMPSWFLMENVDAAPCPSVCGYVVRDRMVLDAAVGGVTSRLRRFSFGTAHGVELRPELVALYAEPEHAALASGGGRPVPVALVRDGKGGHRSKKSALKKYGYATTGAFENHKRLQGLPADFDLPGFTVSAKVKAVGNGVPLPMGRAIAKAVRTAIGLPDSSVRGLPDESTDIVHTR